MTENFPKSELFGISNQMRRAGVSVASNIAEGCARKSRNERIRFFEISRPSLVEVDTQLEISSLLNYINSKDIIEIDDKLNHIFAMMTKLINKTN